MDRNWLIEREGLRGIVLLLFSLACRADRAAKATPAVRRQLLTIIGPAEIIALRLVCGAGAEDPLFALFAWLYSLAYADGGPEDAKRLAARLRALASRLATRTPPVIARRWSVRAAPRADGCLNSHLTRRPALACDALRPVFADTS